MKGTQKEGDTFSHRPSFDNSENYELNPTPYVIGIFAFLTVVVFSTLFYLYVYKPNKSGEWTRVMYQFTYSDGTMIRKIVMENPKYHGIENGCTYGIEPKQCYVREAFKLE